jgi:uncharacterized protein YjbI with pentapeptide repeats
LRGHFSGRHDELNLLRQILATNNGTEATAGICGALIGLHGIGGIGKTALAMQFAERFQQDFPGGILWGDMGTNRDVGERDADVSPNEILNFVLSRWEAELHSSGPPGRPLSALLGSVRALLAVRTQKRGRCLLILDNVDSDETLQPILEGFPYCAILITTRRTELVTLDNVHKIELGGLDRKSSMEYFRWTLGEDDGRVINADPILSYVEDHPLAVKLLAQSMRTDRSLSVEESLRSLRSSSEMSSKNNSARLLTHIPKSLADCFSVSIERLGRNELRTFFVATASQSQVSWPLEAADFVSGVCNLKRSWTLLEGLMARGMVERFESGRYRIHRLLRDFIRESYSRDGFGFIPPTWEFLSLAFLLMRIMPGISAGISVYDRRQEQWALRRVVRSAFSSDVIRLEWDALVSGLYRRLDSTSSAVRDGARFRLTLLAQLLHTADFSHLRLDRVMLDGACLDGVVLEGSDLSGRSPQYFITKTEAITALKSLARQLIGWSAFLSAGSAVAFLLFGVSRAYDLTFWSMTWGTIVAVFPMLFAEFIARIIFGGGQYLDRRTARACLKLEVRVEVLLYLVIVILVVGVSYIPAVAAESSSGLPLWPFLAVGLVVSLMLFAPIGFFVAAGVAGLRDALPIQNIGGLGKRIIRGLATASIPLVLITVVEKLAFFEGRVSLSNPPSVISVVVVALVMWHDVMLAHVRHLPLRVWIQSIPVVTVLIFIFLSAILLVLTALLAEPAEFGSAIIGAVSYMIFGLRKNPECENILYSACTSYLRAARLKGANLRRSVLRYVRLQRADLTGADLTGADLSHADLSDANLTGANLANTCLCNASLSRANLAGARLIGADLTGANLKGAVLDGALWGPTTRWPAQVDGKFPKPPD